MAHVGEILAELRREVRYPAMSEGAAFPIRTESYRSLIIFM